MELADDECVRVWLGRLGGSRDGAWRTFKRFYHEVLIGDADFARMAPFELVEWQANATGRDRYKILQLAQNWLNSKLLRINTKRTRLSYIRGFFLHNHAPMPEDRSFQFKSDLPRVDGRLDLEAFKAILYNCNKMYRAVYLMMAEGLMGEAELVYVSNNLWREVIDHLRKNTGIFKLVLPGRKRNRNVKNYYTLLCTKSDWADAYRNYMRSSSYRAFGALFRNQRGKPLTAGNIQYYFHCRAVEAGVVNQFTPSCGNCHGETVRVRKPHPSGLHKIAYVCKECENVNWACEMKNNSTHVRYGVSPHEIRDLMRSRWHVSGADPLVSEFMMGHEIDSNHYNKFMKYEPWYPIAEYRKALPWLNVLSEDPNKVDRSQIDSELESHKAEIEVLRREVAKSENLRREVADLREQIKAVSWLTDEEKVETIMKGLRLLEKSERKRGNG